MNNLLQNGFIQKQSTPGFVLDGLTPDDVARSSIESGRQKQPFFILDLDKVYSRIKHFRDLMPRIKIFYAMKANDSEMLLKFAVSQGLGFDCASPGEIHKIRKLNVCPQSIIFAVPAKTPEQMMYARDSGVKHTTFDTSYELKKIKQYWPEARLLIRIRVDSDSKYKLGDKFGCDFETEAVDLLEEAASLGLHVIGVAFHVGSACSSTSSFVVGLQQAKALFDHESQAGRGMKIVDIGGGFLSDRTDRIDQVSKLVNDALHELFPDPDVQVIAEPGRYICDSATTLYCNILNVRRIKKDGKNINMIYMNDGIYGTLRFHEPWHTVTKFKGSADKDNDVLEETILWGPSCDSTDRVKKECDIRLPRCTPLDWLVVGMQGAYTHVFSSRFSCLEIPLTRTVISMKLWNDVKDNTVFGPSDFIIEPDISAPLPLTLPALLPNHELNEHSQTPSLVA